VPPALRASAAALSPSSSSPQAQPRRRVRRKPTRATALVREDSSGSPLGSEHSYECDGCPAHLRRDDYTHVCCEEVTCRRGRCLDCHPDPTVDWWCAEHRPSFPVVPVAPVDARPLPVAFRARLETLSEADAFKWVDDAILADPRPPRRWLPVVHFGPEAELASCLSAAVALAASPGGHAAAEVFVLFFPRLFLRRGCSVNRQLRLFAGLPVDSLAPPPSPGVLPDATVAWARRVGSLAATSLPRDVVRLLEAGPFSLPRPNASELDAFFPVPREMAGLGAVPDWAASAEAAETPCFSGSALRRWAIRHLDRSGGSTGWSGRLLLALDAIAAPRLTENLAALWSRPRRLWRSPRLWLRAFRAADGWLIPKVGGVGFRPISAPALPRRLASACDAKRAAPVVSSLCEARGQVGLSGDGIQLARLVATALMVQIDGATLLTADRKDSYTSLRLEAVQGAVARAVGLATEQSDGPAAAALARLAVQCVLPSGGAGLTHVSFAGGGGPPRLVTGLAQGCSASPSMQGLALAFEYGSVPRPRCMRTMLHDDLLIAACEFGDLVAPPAGLVGGEYGSAKSVAVGPLAQQLKDEGRASSVANHLTVWGRPLGSVPDWFREVLLKRVRLRVDRIRKVFAVQPGAAVAAFCSLKGPGPLVEHALRAVTPAAAKDPAVLAVLAEMDRLWEQLAVELVGAPSVTPAVRAALFGAGPAALGHRSAVELVSTAPWDGLAKAWPHLVPLAAQLGWSEGLLARSLDLPESETSEFIASKVESSRKDSELRRSLLAKRAPLAAFSEVPRGADKPKHNLWVAALVVGPNAALPSATLDPLLDSARERFGRACFRTVALARVLGLSVVRLLWPRCVPIVCPRCMAPAESSVSEGTWPGHGWQPTKSLDAACAHAGVCQRAPPWANATVRHNMLCNGLAALAKLCGIPAVTHDRPVGGGFALRPADIFVPPGIGAPRPLAIDVNVTTCSGIGGLNAAIARKEKKYATVLRHNPTLEFVVWGVTEAGWLAPGADGVLRRWATSLIARGDSLVGDATALVRAAAATCFAVAWMFQVAGWAPAEFSGAFSSARSSHRAVARVQRARDACSIVPRAVERTANPRLVLRASPGRGPFPPCGSNVTGPSPGRADALALSAALCGISVFTGRSPAGSTLQSLSSGSRFACQAPFASSGEGGLHSGIRPECGPPA
jgi:hypothetical protein